MKTVTIRGNLFSGEGIGRKFVRISWVQKQIEEKLGFKPYPGTLNLCVEESEARKLGRALSGNEGIKIIPEKGFFSARCFKALVMNQVEGAIVIPEKPNYSPDVLEILAPISLREKLLLTDGDEVEVTVFASGH